MNDLARSIQSRDVITAWLARSFWQCSDVINACQCFFTFYQVPNIIILTLFGKKTHYVRTINF